MVSAQPSSTRSIQLIWGIALVLAGLGMFVYIPQRMSELAQSGSFFGNSVVARLCLYLMAILLVGGGAKKIIRYFRSTPSASSKGSVDQDQSRHDAGRK
ncbi:MAG: hypothetical protein WAU91_13035 [Desulfatitalea sp.]